MSRWRTGDTAGATTPPSTVQLSTSHRPQGHTRARGGPKALPLPRDAAGASVAPQDGPRRGLANAQDQSQIAVRSHESSTHAGNSGHTPRPAGLRAVGVQRVAGGSGSGGGYGEVALFQTRELAANPPRGRNAPTTTHVAVDTQVLYPAHGVHQDRPNDDLAEDMLQDTTTGAAASRPRKGAGYLTVLSSTT